jgi:hypothetical protein
MVVMAGLGTQEFISCSKVLIPNIVHFWLSMCGACQSFYTNFQELITNIGVLGGTCSMFRFV